VNDLRRRVLLFEVDEPRMPIDTFKAHRIREAFGFGVGAYLMHLFKAFEDPESDTLAPELVRERAPQVARLRQLAQLVPAVQPATWPQGEDRVTF
jgi:hypothetical protein